MSEASRRPQRRLPLTLGLIIGLAVVVVLVTLAGTGHDWVFGLLERLDAATRSHYIGAMAVFIALFAILATMTLPVGTLFCLAGGYLFGTFAGAGAALAGACLSAALTFFLARALGGRRAREVLLAGRTGEWMQALERNATWYLILLRIIPVAPFFAVNAAAGVTGITTVHFLVATTIGLIPITLVYAAVGSGLHSIVDARDMLGPEILLRPEVGLPLLALAMLVAASWIIRRKRRSH